VGSCGRELALTLDPDEAVEEVEAATGVGAGPPVRPPDLVGLLREAGVLPDLVHDVGRQRAVPVGLEDDACGQRERQGARWHHGRRPRRPARSHGQGRRGGQRVSAKGTTGAATDGQGGHGPGTGCEGTRAAGGRGGTARTVARRCAWPGSAGAEDGYCEMPGPLTPPTPAPREPHPAASVPSLGHSWRGTRLQGSLRRGWFSGTYWQRP